MVYLYPFFNRRQQTGLARIDRPGIPALVNPGMGNNMFSVNVGNNNFQNLYKHKELSMFPKVYQVSTFQQVHIDFCD